MISTKYGMIDNHMVYLKEKTVELCFGYISSVFKNLDINDIHFIDVKAGDGAFYNYLEGLSRVAYDPLGGFKEANIANFLRVPFIPTDKTMKFSIGFPDVREYESYINHSIELGIDFIAFVVPISGGNKKNRLNYEKHGYTILFNEQLPVDSFRLANGED